VGDRAAAGGGLGVLAQLAALLELVVVAATEGVSDAGTAQQPGHPGRRIAVGELGQPDEHSLRGGALAGDRDVLAGIAGSHGRVAEVGDAVGDVIRVLTLSQGGVAVRAQGVRLAPGAGGVHHRAGQQPLAPRGGLDVHGEGVALPAAVDEQVAAGAADSGHPSAVADGARGGGVEQLGQGAQVRLTPLTAGRVTVLIGRGPAAGGLEQAPRGGVDELAPRREQPDVSPLGDRCPGVAACLEHDEVQVALDRVGGSRQADGAGTDDDHGVLHDTLLQLALDRQTSMDQDCIDVHR
jgi:hypothetical protein